MTRAYGTQFIFLFNQRIKISRLRRDYNIDRAYSSAIFLQTAVVRALPAALPTSFSPNSFYKTPVSFPVLLLTGKNYSGRYFPY